MALLLLVVLGACSKFQKLQREGSVEEKYDAAMKYYEKDDFFRASVLLEELIPVLKGTERAEQAQLTFAYCNYYQGDLILSAFYFKSFVETYPRSQFVEEAAFMQALSEYQDSAPYNLDQTSTYSAIENLHNFMMQYPESSYKDTCSVLTENLRQKLERKAYENAKLYLKKEDFKAAIITFDNFKKDFPESAHNEEVTYLKVESAYLLARNSVAAKQPERYAQVIKFYQNFVDSYPKSKFVRDAERMYDNATARTAPTEKK
ncbi:outer membrane protein assembly factor BamD [Flexibacter flexilis DSM 6793]|uniref:Outer membrane protein assembly factor BamD n=1 Tax=Flexibacter flexilis DSM 6793 TaxID=927664 RepID=A0A1I1JJF5_9BACT|nr:outer membrane protein assembly factor BamD [Flexibacter flexilis]SFC48301.1 outer membrane protein assembly factor BamD [Flexibacter flexilis DSM 6793]